MARTGLEARSIRGQRVCATHENHCRQRQHEREDRTDHGQPGAPLPTREADRATRKGYYGQQWDSADRDLDAIQPPDLLSPSSSPEAFER